MSDGITNAVAYYHRAELDEHLIATGRVVSDNLLRALFGSTTGGNSHSMQSLLTKGLEALDGLVTRMKAVLKSKTLTSVVQSLTAALLPMRRSFYAIATHEQHKRNLLNTALDNIGPIIVKLAAEVEIEEGGQFPEYKKKALFAVLRQYPAITDAWQGSLHDVILGRIKTDYYEYRVRNLYRTFAYAAPTTFARERLDTIQLDSSVLFSISKASVSLGKMKDVKSWEIELSEFPLQSISQQNVIADQYMASELDKLDVSSPEGKHIQTQCNVDIHFKSTHRYCPVAQCEDNTSLNGSIRIEFPVHTDAVGLKEELAEIPCLASRLTQVMQHTLAWKKKHTHFNIIVPTELPPHFLFVVALAFLSQNKTLSAYEASLKLDFSSNEQHLTAWNDLKKACEEAARLQSGCQVHVQSFIELSVLISHVGT
jgi:hypothetical protein